MTAYTVRHTTSYQYGQRMSSGQSLIHLMPRETSTQVVNSCDIFISPVPDERDEWVDAFGNKAESFTITEPHDSLEVTAVSKVEVTVPAVPVVDEPWEQVMAKTAVRSSADSVDVQQFVVPSPFVSYSFDLHSLATRAFAADRSFDDALRGLSRTIYEEYEFDPSFSDVSTPLDDVLIHHRGVCQDFAHLMIGALRAVGFAARYVSGYIETDPPLGEEKFVGSDVSHAWCAVYVPGVGWIDADPTNDQIPPRRHVTIGWGRDYGDVAPFRGVVLGPSASQVMSVEVDVARDP